MKIISVSQVTGYIKEKLESDLILNNLWIKGEISNFKHHSSGHMYFTLKDRNSALRCIMFKSRNQSLDFAPREGLAVVARGSIAVYERDGQYQLYVEEMLPQGIGALYSAFLQLKDKLEKEGLFAPERKKPLPAFPKKIGVVTSPTGAAVKDIINVMTRRYPQVHIILIPVAVQGQEAPAQIAEGIRLANSIDGLELIIVGRGGGSIEELWAFNTEVVARSIESSSLPVISAVGHQTDFTIADFIADMRAPTPSAAAELAVPDCLEVRKHLNVLTQRLVAEVRNNLAALKDRVDRATQSPFLKKPKDELYKKMQDVDYLTRRLGQTMIVQLNGKKTAMALQMSRLNDLSPMATINRGFAICRDKRGTVIKQITGVKPGESLEILMTGGSLDCTVEKVKEGEYGRQKEG